METPTRIIVCAVQGDWIDWEHDRAPEHGDCPFGECECLPALYVRHVNGDPDWDGDDDRS